jgi:phosphoribosylanthranilate isomerase
VRAGDIVRQLPQAVEKVGVFVNEDAEVVRSAVTTAGLTAIQLHGDETPDVAQYLKRKVPGVKIARAVSFGVLVKAGSANPQDAADFVLVDGAPAVARGGSGINFDWHAGQEALSRLHGVKVAIAGGLTPENVSECIRVLRPWGVDVVSGVEAFPGKKDPRKVRAFVQAVRTCENQYVR